MSRRRKHTPDVPASLPLRVNDLLFITEYLSNGRNGKRAYLTVHPGIKACSAEVGAARLLSQAKVQQELATRIKYDGGVTKAFVESSLLKYQQWAEDAHDYIAGASICMDAAKLAGFLVDQHKDLNASASDLTEDQIWSELEKRLAANKVAALPLPVVVQPLSVETAASSASLSE